MTRFIGYSLALVMLAMACMSLASCTRQETDSAGVDRYNRGVAYLEAGDYKNAITEFEAALRADPNNFEAMKNLAGAYADDGNMYEARDHYLLARDMRPTDPSIYANLAYVYNRLGETELAWENISKALENDPEYPLAHYRAGELFLDQGDETNAVAAFGDAIRYERGESRLSRDAQTIIDQLTCPDEDEGLEDEGTDEEQSEEEVEEEEILEEEPASEEAVEDEMAADEEEATGDEETEEDEEAMEGTEEEGTEDEGVEEGTEEGETDEEAVEEEEGTEEAEEEEIEPELELPELEGDELYQDRLSRGRRMRAIGSTDAAIRLLLEAYGVHPDYAQVNYELGMAYLTAGDTAQGRTYLEKYLELETDPALRAEVEQRLAAIGGTEEETEENGEEGTGEGESEEDTGEEEENSSFFF